jgi:PhnB protein
LNEKHMSGTPDGVHTITPEIVVKDAAAAIAYYREVFGAVECARMLVPGSDRIFHASIRIGDFKALYSRNPGGWAVRRNGWG